MPASRNTPTPSRPTTAPPTPTQPLPAPARSLASHPTAPPTSTQLPTLAQPTPKRLSLSPSLLDLHGILDDVESRVGKISSAGTFDRYSPASQQFLQEMSDMARRIHDSLDTTFHFLKDENDQDDLDAGSAGHPTLPPLPRKRGRNNSEAKNGRASRGGRNAANKRTRIEEAPRTLTPTSLSSSSRVIAEPAARPTPPLAPGSPEDHLLDAIPEVDRRLALVLNSDMSPFTDEAIAELCYVRRQTTDTAREAAENLSLRLVLCGVEDKFGVDTAERWVNHVFSGIAFTDLHTGVHLSRASTT
jgi:hypothetical protein